MAGDTRSFASFWYHSFGIRHFIFFSGRGRPFFQILARILPILNWKDPSKIRQNLKKRPGQAGKKRKWRAIPEALQAYGIIPSEYAISFFFRPFRVCNDLYFV
uniref:hypothetical protein n=1 Tax=Cephaleuros karstenii TaxID=1985640 RepID=UPI001EDE64BA|nr:hypothetical protein MFR52_pgp096 [Cephaleuros karstenii]UIB39063.1 hypothetical protein [Cephaleuros karstenii]